eukprot:TRINITY_DN62360_c0_g1_i1.p1 TRINITY_DN62360_c0_g1~~TRINITY_DN62360_c0_g1_i1.p1  ORF type:complete len:433 (-),score=64.33 TRINITY_DN62360_c0_g1_i1:55-1353(-)
MWLGLSAAVLVSSGVVTTRADLFDIFPAVDVAQHSVFAAESVQLVGTVDAAALEAALPAPAGRRWRGLRISDEALEGRAPRVLLSVGIGSFRNTSIGAYKELAIAFPSCESEKDITLECKNFISCQSRFPDCAYTFMFRSFASTEAAVALGRAVSIDTLPTEQFTFGPDPDRPNWLSFSAVGTDGEEVLRGSVELSPGNTAAHASSGDGQAAAGAPAAGGYRLQTFVGGLEGQKDSRRTVRHLCAFPSGLPALPARLAGDVHGGDLLRDLDFEVDGALHLPMLQLVRLPPWGGSGSSSRDSSCGSGAERAPSVPGVDVSGRRSTSSSGSSVVREPASDRRAVPRRESAEGPTDFMDLLQDFNNRQDSGKGDRFRVPDTSRASDGSFPFHLHQAGTEKATQRTSPAAAPVVSDRIATRRKGAETLAAGILGEL